MENIVIINGIQETQDFKVDFEESIRKYFNGERLEWENEIKINFKNEVDFEFYESLVGVEYVDMMIVEEHIRVCASGFITRFEPKEIYIVAQSNVNAINFKIERV